MIDNFQQIPPGFLEKLFAWILGLLTRLKPASWFRRKPTALHFHCERSNWSMGTVNGQDAMYANGHWRVTNATNTAIELWSLRVRVPFYRLGRKISYAHVLVRHPRNNVYSSRHPILARSTSEVSADFWVVPPLMAAGENVTLTIEFIDQYNHHHKQRRVVFLGLSPSVPEAEPALEATYSLNSQLEKDVVSILKSEVIRYRANGRPQGGLGSFAITLDGRRMESGFADWRNVGTGKEQSIVSPNSEVQVDSDNFSRLRALYSNLATTSEKDAFREMLLKRIRSDTEYAPIAYFVVWFFLVEGFLKDCLDRAKGSLTGTQYPLGKWALSDAFRILDLLLQYQPLIFDERRLDQLEESLVNVSEHTFHIHDRIAAIRASRVDART